ncbi:GLPGLI family protein [Tenacibaculum sp. M341]|nr:GLPGLI family protein [Tenacibaculum sp. M341]
MSLLILPVVVMSQNFQGKATYKTHRKVEVKMQDGEAGITSDIQKQLHEKMKKMFQKTFTLNFNKSSSTYIQNEELDPEVKSGGVQVMVFGNGGTGDVLYKNIVEKRYANKTEISGKRFLIKDKLEKPEWEMTSEAKKIGKYTCYKATRTKEEERISQMMTDGEVEEKKEMVTVVTTAWFTPEIPVSNGPSMYWGLPGLILEVHEGKQTIICSEIVLNPTKKIEVDEPKKGKKVSQKEIDAIIKEKTQEMIERFKGRRGGDGDSMSIEIRG